MGSVSTFHGTELSLALDELGVTGGYTKVIRKAAGGTQDGDKLTWFILEQVKTGQQFIALALTRRGASFGVWCKVQDETVGPCFYDVPASIWDNRPPVDESYQYAVQWREAVEARKAAWPLSLDQVPVGTEVRIDWYPGTWTRVGSYNGQPTFSGTAQGIAYRNTRLRGWKNLRAKPVEAVTE